MQVAQEIDVTRARVAMFVLDQKFAKDELELVSGTHQSQTHVALAGRAQLRDGAPHLKQTKERTMKSAV